jgi:ABC-2 type transport system ATP-binding protein
MPVIEVNNLKKNYPLPARDRKSGDVFEAVKGVSFSVEKGEIFGILGPNGAGKTTTLEIIEGIKQKTSGEIKVLGLNSDTESAEIKKRIGVQLQSSSYFTSVTLGELILLFASIYKKKVNPTELLSFVGLQDKEHEVVKNLSGGQKQRFTLATALVNEPEILFLDEPTTGLDPRARRDVWQLVRQINSRGVSIVLTTHYMEEAEFLCSRVAIMDNGKILTINKPRLLVEDLSDTVQVSFFTNDDTSGLWKNTPEVEKVYSNYPKVILEVKSLDSIPKILELLRKEKIEFTGFTVKTATLEDVYLNLTGRELAVEY